MRYARASQVSWDKARWPNFRAHEFACKCGGRFCNEYWRVPIFWIVCNSGMSWGRWSSIPASMRLVECGGGWCAEIQTQTIAADISLMGHDRHAVLNAARRAGFNGLGLAQTFLHVDRRSIPATWYYGQKSRNLWNS